LEAVTEHCHRLGLGEWAELDVHEDGREVDVEAGDRCPKRWLVEGPVLETFA